MWVAQLQLPYRQSSLFSDLARAFKVHIAGYAVKHVASEDYAEIMGHGYVQGIRSREFLAALLKDERVVSLEVRANAFVIHTRQHKALSALFEAGTMPLSPFIVREDGSYSFEIGGFQRSLLVGVVEKLAFFDARLTTIRQQPFPHIGTLAVFPELTEKQRTCFQLATEHGYYDRPRKITLKQLAKINKVAYSTFQQHLQVAEKKLLPCFGRFGICR